MRGMLRGKTLPLLVTFAALGMSGVNPARAAEETVQPSFMLSQSNAGKTIFNAQCAECHGEDLNGAQAVALRGEKFQTKWAGKSVQQLFTQMRTTMPAATPNSLTEEEYVNVMAYIFHKNIILPSEEALTADPAKMSAMAMPTPSVMHAQLEPGVKLPPPPEVTPNPLDKMTPVTEAMLRKPSNGDWLTWRRTRDSQGFSPLTEINKDNVSRLRPAWAWALPNGANEATPLVHDGVLFIYGANDVVQALNATNGDLLWEYNRFLPKGVNAGFKKALAIYGTTIYTPTADGKMLALDAKTGEVLWESQVGPDGTRMTGGPLIAKDKVIVGTTRKMTDPKYLGGYIIAFDAKSGKEMWRFATVPGPNDPGGDTWNDLPLEKRSGGSVWVPGSYDPELNLVFFGSAQTYDTGPLRDRKPGSESTNNGLYTDSSIALNPDTGKLSWHFQHLPNDQWDLDWAFERVIVTLPVNGRPEKVIVTSGKDAIHDGVVAKTGKYLFSLDSGLQNFIKSIDPKTGERHYDPAKIPDGKTPVFVCPGVAGGRNWIPSSYNPDTKMLYAPMIESCMYLSPIPEGETGLLSTGVRTSLSPREDSDGRFGRLQAMNLETRQIVWKERRRAPSTSGALATAGGVVFAGYLDRMFMAYDDATGKELWSMRLGEVPSSAPISYAVNGKQYVAVVLGMGGTHSRLFMPFVPEIKNPVNRSSSIWVFEVADTP